MDSKKLLTSSVIVKTEPNVTASKKVLLTSSQFSQLASKNISNARLASFKPPRDLLLTGSTTSHSNATLNLGNSSKSAKRTFTPNINVTRRKGTGEASQNDSSVESNHKLKDRDKNNKPPPNKKRNVNFLQTKGVFSEGLAPGKVKAFSSSSCEKVYNERVIMDKPKLNLNKKINKTEEDSKLKSVLKDDLIEDPSVVPDTNFLPNCLPMMFGGKKSEKSGDLEKTFETLQVKTEKKVDISLKSLKSEPQNVTSVFENNKSPKLFLFEFPIPIQQQDDSSENKKLTKVQSIDNDKQNAKLEGLSSLGEGFFGYLRIHKNGKAYLTAGDTVVPMCLVRHGTRQEIMSTELDAEKSKGEVISLGTIDANFNCSANFFQDVR